MKNMGVLTRHSSSSSSRGTLAHGARIAWRSASAAGERDQRGGIVVAFCAAQRRQVAGPKKAGT